MTTKHRLIAAVVLFAGGCDSGGPSAGERQSEGGAVAEPAMANEALSAEEAARLRQRAVAALVGVLPGAASAEYANVRSGSAGAACGEVDAGDGLGLRPFIVTADGLAMVSLAADLRLEDPNDPFPDLYMRYCASTEELLRIGARLEGLRPPDLVAPPLGEALPIPGEEPDAMDATHEPSTQRANPPRGEGDDSFFNSVIRPPRQPAPPG